MARNRPRYTIVFLHKSGDRLCTRNSEKVDDSAQSSPAPRNAKTCRTKSSARSSKIGASFDDCFLGLLCAGSIVFVPFPVLKTLCESTATNSKRGGHPYARQRLKHSTCTATKWEVCLALGARSETFPNSCSTRLPIQVAVFDY